MKRFTKYFLIFALLMPTVFTYAQSYQYTTSKGAIIEANVSLYDTVYPVSGVYAYPNQDDTECLITWNIPPEPYEISYDDGTANYFVTWITPGNAVAVKFTPAGYPATVTGGRMFVGDGTFPDSANFMGSRFAIGVLDDDGTDGMPGTVIDSITVDVNNYGWVVFEGMNATIPDGDFYLVMWQTTFAPNAAPIGIDNDLPTAYRSYVKNSDSDWMVSPYQDFMMRAIVSGPNAGLMTNNSSAGRIIQPPKIGNFTGFMATSLPKGVPGVEKAGTFTPVPTQSNVRDLTNYTVAIVDGFDPDAGQTPDDGTITTIANTDSTSYNHTGWGSEPQGWYAYGVRANYDSSQSVFVYSNIVGHLMDVAVTINIQTCDGSEPDDAEVRLVGHNYPYNSYFGITDTTGIIVFDSVTKGNYDIYAEKVGYQDYEHLNTHIIGDYTENIIMQEKAYPVRNFTVDSLTSNATWDTPLITELENEDFEGTTFPPEGWQSTTVGIGWFRSDGGGSEEFPVPPSDGFYAISNSDAAGCVSNGTADYLITPEMDLRESDNFNLYFDSYFTGAYGESGYVEYSLDGGVTWEYPLYTATYVTDWTKITVDLSSLSGETGISSVWFAFYATDHGSWASGWAVDNVSIHNGAPQVEAYDIFLDDAFIVEVPGDQLSYAFENLTYGTTYTASVQAKYSTFCMLSPKVYYTWTSSFLYSPRNISEAYIYGTDEVPVTWNPPMTDDGIPMDATESAVVYDDPQTIMANADQKSGVTRIEYAQHSGDGAIDAGVVPDGLLSFNVYRDGNVIGTKDYNGEGVEDDILYIDNNVMPGTYMYEVSSVYDLTQFGFPGETGESALDGVDTVTVIWGMKLPFTEDWAIGNFDFNNWTTDAPNWKINSEIGDDEPSAEFSGDSLLENDYSASLTSAPMKADLLSEGDIWLDYNIRLDDSNSTGNEHLKVEVYDGDSWTQVADVANNGSFGFDDGFNHINIRELAMGKVFQVRFTATGQTSFDIVSWFVDNINVYRSCGAPTDLTAKYVWYNNPDNENDWGAMIDWEAPPYIPPPAIEWLHWDDGTNYSAIGLTDGGDFSVAARWDAGQLSDYDGTYITKLQYFPAATYFNNLIVRIWTGDDASNLIYENDVTDSVVAGTWNVVELPTPIALDVNDELWVGYTILGQVANTFPVGTDDGPAIAGYGDKITIDGVTWDNLSDFGFNNNFNIQVYVQQLSTNAGPIAPIIDNTVYSTANATLSQGAVVENGAQARTASDRSFTGFKLYRSETGDEGSYVEYATIPYEDGVTTYSYYDKYPNVQAGGEYWYKVSAMWEGENDVCESAFALDHNNQMHDYVNVFVTSVDNPLAGVTNVYPNPARDNVTVTTTEGINKITVINYVGQVVYQKALKGESSVNLNTGNYDAGVYVIRIETVSGTTNKRVVITK